MIGAMLCYPPNYTPTIIPPPGLRVENALIDKSLEEAYLRDPQLKEFTYVGSSFVHKEYSG
jgi:hypothetical protein